MNPKRRFTSEFKTSEKRKVNEGALGEDERTELKRLRRENRELKIEKEILKKQEPSLRSTCREISFYLR